MRDEHYWPDWDSDPVERPQPSAPEEPAETTQLIAEEPLEAEPDDEDAPDDPGLVGELLEGEDHGPVPVTPARRFRTGVGRALMITGGTIALLVVLYVADLMLSAGDVPRGVTVAGVEVGGMSRSDAETTLRDELAARLIAPVPVRAGDVQTHIDPVTFGLGLDWQATLEQAGSQPLNPITRVLSFFRTREVGVVTNSAPDVTTQAVADLAREQLNHELTEGTIRFEPVPGSDGRVRAVAVEPRQGQTLTGTGEAVRVLTDNWLSERDIEFPMRVSQPKVSSTGVHAALDRYVTPAIAAPIQVQGNGKQAVLKPNATARSFEFEPGEAGALRVKIDPNRLRSALHPELAGTEQESKDARIVFTGGSPTVQPAEPGRTIDWQRTLAPFLQVATKAEGRQLTVVYDTREPETSTEDANRFGIKEVVGEFSTGGFSGDVARNVAAIAAQVDGTIVRPGQTFSLDEHTGPRTASNGYVTAPVHEDGTGPGVIGGGVSQFTTTLYNATYFAGLKDAGHTEHPTYFDRYPVARDAISLQEDGSGVDLAFTNDAPTGVAIQASASGNTVTVRIWGTKRYRVESSTGPTTDVVPPPIEVGRPGECTPAEGSPGFSTSDTRVLYDLGSGSEVRRETRSVTYAPRPTILC